MAEMSKEQVIQRKLNELHRMINPVMVPNDDDREAMRDLVFRIQDLVREG